jgi:hypothetical protein
MEEVSKMFAFNSTLTQLIALPEKILKEMFSWLMDEDCLCPSTMNISLNKNHEEVIPRQHYTL